MNTILVLLFISSQILGKTKPISGRVKSDSDTYLLNVRVESLPSKTTTKTDKNGMFFFVLRMLKPSIMITERCRTKSSFCEGSSKL